MTVVDLHVDTQLLPDYEALRDREGWHETGRRPTSDPNRPDTTIVSLDMPDAPATATVMDVIVEKQQNEHLKVQSIWYFDGPGHANAPASAWPRQ